ncbi:lytic transglycosylase domain-containing protein [Pontibacillus yanchengensis]|uniref:lytic transglycosylase domain-containing protein n=1 Tax=Pontibacillus yanchengensis TaxID=462910 RepID=UPI00056D9ECF|nr:transglycosylase SLT domain-containing protein [Pontibacillus yanchengensis]
MQRIKSYSQLLLLFLFITISFMLMLHFYGEKTETLQEKNEQLREKNEELKSENDYMANMETSFKEKNGYHIWPERDKVAQKMVKESEGRFKKTWALYLVREAKRYEIDPYLAYELLKVETGGKFDPTLVGPETKYGRAYGMSQFMKNTAPWIADMGGLPYEEELLFDPYYSMQLSLIYLDFLHNEYGNWNEALTAYHRGMSGMETYKDENGHAKSWYAEEIQEKAKSHEALAFAE